MTLVWSPDYAPVDGDFDSVSLLLKGEGTNGSTTILDSSSNNLSVSVNGNTQISTAVSTPFGAGDGVLKFSTSTAITNTNLKLNSSDLVFDADFTFETWCYATQLPTGFQNTITEHGANVNAGSTAFSTGFAVRADNAGTSWNINVAGTSLTAGTIVTNQWTHLAVSREGSIFKFFLDGVLQGFGTNSNIVNPSQLNCNIGSRPDGDRPFVGYLSNLRITKGVARYTENFDVPTAPFPILSPSTRIEVGDGFDVEAANYILAVEAADATAGQSGGLEAGVRTAINDFVVGCKSDGIWNAIKASCLLSGARTLEGALVPLKGGAPTNFNFTSSDYDRELGLVGDGSTKYLDSNRANNADPDANNHNAIYMTTGANGGKMGASNNKIRNSSFGNRTTTYFTGFGSPSLASVNNSLVGHTRISSSEYTYYIGDTPRTGVVPQAGQSASSDNVFIFDDGFGSRTSSRFAFYSIGESLDLALLDTRVSNLMTAIGAAIP